MKGHLFSEEDMESHQSEQSVLVRHVLLIDLGIRYVRWLGKVQWVHIHVR